ncbi:hypothetical protein BGZ46_003294 [Entomortierella lignicola]|nr:hypothetical protein BGZ46_003294 [Entomortierella lignicola]
MYTGIIYYTVVTGNSHTATSFLIIEVPTFIMGLGFLHKPLRNDMLFGASYFLFRVLFDFTLSHEMIMNRPDMATAAKIMVLFKFLMNFKFFIDWIKQQIRLRRQRASVRAEKLCETTGVRTTEVVLVGHDILLSLPASSIAPKLSVSSKVGNEITSLVYQPQQKTMRQQSKQRKSQSSQKAKRRSSNDMPAAATPDAPFPILSPSKPRYGIRNRSTRTRTGGMMNDQPFVDMIAAY